MCFDVRMYDLGFGHAYFFLNMIALCILNSSNFMFIWWGQNFHNDECWVLLLLKHGWLLHLHTTSFRIEAFPWSTYEWCCFSVSVLWLMRSGCLILGVVDCRVNAFSSIFSHLHLKLFSMQFSSTILWVFPS